MLIKKIKKMLLGMMVLTSPIVADPAGQELSFGRCCVAFCFTYFVAKCIVKSTCSEEPPVFWSLAGLTAGAGLTASAYDQPFTSPLIGAENVMFGLINGAKYIVSRPLVVGNAICNSISKCDSNFIWGVSMFTGMALTAWYCRNKYKKQMSIRACGHEETIINFQTNLKYHKEQNEKREHELKRVKESACIDRENADKLAMRLTNAEATLREKEHMMGILSEDLRTVKFKLVRMQWVEEELIKKMLQFLS